jgi:pyridoxamine 5'-phosphate oxidase
MELGDMRRDYEHATLEERDLAPTWLGQLSRWLDEAVASPSVVEANAMVFSTADADGHPSSRTVLLKGLDERGLVLYTNLGSRKGREASANPWGSLLFPWYALERQVIAVGAIERVDEDEADAYFASRPYGSRIGAHASPQSQVIADRSVLDAAKRELEERFPEGSTVPRPERWGGLRLVPETVEFWQGRPNRLHDRLRFRRTDGKRWIVERLAP